MEAEFYSVVSHTRAYDRTKCEVALQGLRGALTRWEKELRKTSPEIRSVFVNHFYSELQRTAFVLCTIQNNKIQSSYVRIFTKLQLEKHTASPVTYLFQQFIRGITQFDFQDFSEIPIYYRLESPDNGSDAFPEHRGKILRRIEICYIERCIYDRIYQHMRVNFPSFALQDEHMKDTEDGFRSYFPDLEIEVHLEFDMHWPVALEIIRKLHGKVVSIERYRKSIIFYDHFALKKYEEAIDAYRETQHYRYMRVQRYSMSPGWIRIGPAMSKQTT